MAAAPPLPPPPSLPPRIDAPALAAPDLQRILDAAFPGNRQCVARVTARGVQLAFAVDAAHDQVPRADGSADVQTMIAGQIR